MTNLSAIQGLIQAYDLEALWDKARAEAQDEGRKYLSIACKGKFNI